MLISMIMSIFNFVMTSEIFHVRGRLYKYEFKSECSQYAVKMLVFGAGKYEQTTQIQLRRIPLGSTIPPRIIASPPRWQWR